MEELLVEVKEIFPEAKIQEFTDGYESLEEYGYQCDEWQVPYIATSYVGIVWDIRDEDNNIYEIIPISLLEGDCDEMADYEFGISHTICKPTKDKNKILEVLKSIKACSEDG